jgi:hypothetical protein
MLFAQMHQFIQMGLPTGTSTELPGTMPIPVAMWDDFYEGVTTAQSTSILQYDVTATGTAVGGGSFAVSIGDTNGVYNVTSSNATNDEMLVRTRGIQNLVAGKPLSCFARVRSAGSTATHHVVWGLWSNGTTAVSIAQAQGIGFRFYNGFLQIGARNDTVTVAWANVAPMAAATFYALGIITDGIKHQFYVDGVKVGEIALDCLKASGASVSGVYAMGLGCGTTATSPLAVSRGGVDYWGIAAVR